jgi:hypothetical protein
MKWKNTFLVGLYKCEMTYSKSQGIHAKWSPKLPGASRVLPARDGSVPIRSR